MEAVPIAGTEGADAPFFSPDGQFGFRAEGQLRKVSVTGGAPVTLAEAEGALRSASWSSDDTILLGGRGGILRVSESGGTPEVVDPAPADDIGFIQPQLLPDGEWDPPMGAVQVPQGRS